MKENFVTLDDVFEIIYEEKIDSSGRKLSRVAGFALGGAPLSDKDLLEIKSDAHQIKNSLLWKLLVKRGYFAAQVKGVDNAKDFGDTREARGMISAISIFEDILSKLENFEVEKK